MDKDFIIIIFISGWITDFSSLVGYPPDPPDQLTINIYKIKKILSALIFHIFHRTLIFFTDSLSSLNLQSPEAPPPCESPARPWKSRLPHSS
jgi:hypothetical protein